MIVRQLRVGPMVVFAYIVGSKETKEALVIDPAGDERTILNTLKSLELNLKYIVNTHGHPDHTCGNQKIQERTGAVIVMHQAEARLFDNPEARMTSRQMGFDSSPPVGLTVRDGEHINVGEVNLEVIHTPGHTPGGMCLYSPGHLFTGDTLFVGAVGRTDFPGGSLKTLLNSIKTRLLVLPDETIVWPGHDYGDAPRSTIGREKKTNPFITDY
jgi:glyoxylase-like metal-dependent hydrolase (beta-lactamase superfamily II)